MLKKTISLLSNMFGEITDQTIKRDGHVPLFASIYQGGKPTNQDGALVIVPDGDMPMQA
jgi:hypothetical protein